MKTAFTLLLSLTLIVSLTAFAQEAPQPIRLAEIEQFSQAVLNTAIKEELPPFEDAGVFLARGENYELTLSGEDLSEDSLVLGAALTGVVSHAHEGEGANLELLIGPRGSLPGMTAEELLSLFPNDNPVLAGRPDSAVLYIAGELPAAVSVGFIVRDGQQVQLVEHDVYYQAGEGVMRTGIQYTVEEGRVTAIRSFVSTNALSQQEAAEELAKYSELQEQNQYVAFGEREGSQFVREDMVLAGLDFIDTTPESAAAVLGEPMSSETLDNADQSQLLSQQWSGIELVFLSREDVAVLQRMQVNGLSHEGPRGLRIGDTLAQAISRFEHTGEMNQGGGALYGDALNQNPPYGLMVVSEDNTLLYYAVTAQEQKVALILEFVDDLLVSMSLTYL